MASAGTLKGTALVPGISRNGRWYKPEAIARAVARAQERLADGSNPITMLTHHGAEDDSTRIVGRLTSVTLADDGSAKWTAQLADTEEARTIATLTDPDDPYLTGVSIRGWWMDDPTVEMAPSGEMVETADDLEIDGLDFTRSPGVPAARIGESAPGPVFSEDGRTVVSVGGRKLRESIPEVLVEASKAPYGDVQYADPGYRSDKVKRYPLDTKAHAKAAWSFINQADNAADYSAAQLKRIKGRIKAALTKFGVDVTAETAPAAPVREFAAEPTIGEITECWGDYGNQVGTAGFSVSLYNGPLTISVSAYSGIEAEKLAAIGAAAMAAAVQAVGILDPDTDGDVDGPMGDDEAKPDDNNLEAAPAAQAETKETAPVAPVTETTEPPSTEPAADEVAPTDEGTETETEPAAATESVEDRILARLLERLSGAPAVVEATPPAAAAEPASTVVAETAVTETEDAMRERIRTEEATRVRDGLLEEIRSGRIGLSRKGLVPRDTAEAAEPTKPLHEMSAEEFHAYKRTLGLAEWAIPGASV